MGHAQWESKIPATIKEAAKLVAEGVQVPIAAVYRLPEIKKAVQHVLRGAQGASRRRRSGDASGGADADADARSPRTVARQGAGPLRDGGLPRAVAAHARACALAVVRALVPGRVAVVTDDAYVRSAGGRGRPRHGRASPSVAGEPRKNCSLRRGRPPRYLPLRGPLDGLWRSGSSRWRALLRPGRHGGRSQRE